MPLQVILLRTIPHLIVSHTLTIKQSIVAYVLISDEEKDFVDDNKLEINSHRNTCLHFNNSDMENRTRKPAIVSRRLGLSAALVHLLGGLALNPRLVLGVLDARL